MATEKTPNEKYVETYVDILKSNLTDQVHRNLSLQANSKVYTEMLQTMQGQITLLNEEIEKSKTEGLKEKDNEIAKLKNQIQAFGNKNKENADLKSQVQSLSRELDLASQKAGTNVTLQNTINQLSQEKNTLSSTLNQFRDEYDSLKNQVSHIETFKNQITDLQKSLAEKNRLLEELQSKIEVVQPEEPVEEKTEVSEQDLIDLMTPQEDNPVSQEETVKPEQTEETEPVEASEVTDDNDSKSSSMEEFMKSLTTLSVDDEVDSSEQSTIKDGGSF